jgi:MFS family permease
MEQTSAGSLDVWADIRLEWRRPFFTEDSGQARSRQQTMTQPTADAPEVQAETPAVRRWLGLEWPRFASWQWRILIVLTFLNLFNYFDRQIIFPMFPLLGKEFHLSDTRLGLLGSALILVHSLSVLPLGYFSDRGPRQKIMAGGVLFWSLATMLSGVATTFKSLLTARALVGIGEAAYAPAGTAIISDSFPEEYRARVQSVFNMGMLVGGVLGLAAGGVLAEMVGWRIAFFLVGLPGLALALACYRLRVPGGAARKPAPPVLPLLKNLPYVIVLLGGALAVFAGASFISWGAVFAVRYQDLSVAEAATSIGALVLVGSVAGVLGGGYVADVLHARWPWGRAFTVGITLLLGSPFLYWAITTESRLVFFLCLFMATTMLTCYHGPVTAVIHDLTPQEARALAFAVYLFVIHFFGDTIAPALVGHISDRAELRRGLLVAVRVNTLAGLCYLVVAVLIGYQALRARRKQA